MFFKKKIMKPKFIVEDETLMPTRATTGSCGYDFYIPQDVTLHPNEVVIVDSKVKVKMPKGMFLALYPRSSMGIKKRIVLANSTGIIDSDYLDTIKIALVNQGKNPKKLFKGERVMQGVFQEYITTDDKVLSERSGGIGSTGK